MHFSLEVLTYLSIIFIGGFFVVSSFEKKTLRDLKDLKERIKDLESDIEYISKKVE